MKRSGILLLCAFMVWQVTGCKRVSLSDLMGTVWENKVVLSDPQMGVEEVKLTIQFNYDQSVVIRRSERWIEKKTSLDINPPADQETVGQYRIENGMIRTLWSDGGSIDFNYQKGSIVTVDGSRIFTKSSQKVPARY